MGRALTARTGRPQHVPPQRGAGGPQGVPGSGAAWTATRQQPAASLAACSGDAPSSFRMCSSPASCSCLLSGSTVPLPFLVFEGLCDATQSISQWSHGFPCALQSKVMQQSPPLAAACYWASLTPALPISGPYCLMGRDSHTHVEQLAAGLVLLCACVCDSKLNYCAAYCHEILAAAHNSTRQLLS